MINKGIYSTAEQFRPLCYQCRKPVEYWHHAEDMLNDAHLFIAQCHGETERHDIPREFFHNRGIEAGFAFVHKELEEEKKHLEYNKEENND